jgi:chemotaxis protein CheD
MRNRAPLAVMAIDANLTLTLERVVIGVADMRISADPKQYLITYALGSCLGVSIYDPVARVGGLLHIMLPESAIDPQQNGFNPYKYVDTGIPSFFKDTYKLGAQKHRLIVKLAGCAQIADDAGIFNIGKRNYAAARKLLWKNNVLIEAEHCGESISRTMSLEIATGRVLLKMGKEQIEL